MTNEQLDLSADKRTIVGKQVRKLRREGKIPANIYGPQFESMSISVDYKNFVHVYRQAKGTGIVTLKIENETIPVLIKEFQRHPLTNNILHVDFRKINLNQKIQTVVPVRPVGESEAVNQHNGVLMYLKEEIEIEALPKNIPEAIDVDISVLKEIGDMITIADLPIEKTLFTIIEDPETPLFSVTAHQEEEILPDVESAAPEVISEKPSDKDASSEAES